MINIKIKEIIISFWEKDDFSYFYRDFKIPRFNTSKAVSLIGPRRSGKTSICFLAINELFKKGIDKNNILYINFEDERLIDFTVDNFDELLKNYFELSGKSTKDLDIYFFFDEIQNIKGWEKFVVRILNNFNIKIVVTGSSAKMLSKEVDTALRGKNLSFEILPLNFSEFLKFKNINFPENFKYSIDGYNLYKKTIKDFITWGAFPEIVLEKDEKVKSSILKTYYDLIFYKDIVDRYSIRDIANLKKFRKILTYNFAEYISQKKVAEQLNVSYQIIQNWFEYFLDAYYGFSLKKFSFSLKQVERSVAKFYLSDNGFFYSNFGDLNEMNLSRLFENSVFLELRKSGFVENENIFYYKDKDFDIDFILFKKGKIIPIQVCYELNENNYKREIIQLENLIKKFNLEKAILVVFENKLETKLDNIDIIGIEELADFFK